MKLPWGGGGSKWTWWIWRRDDQYIILYKGLRGYCDVLYTLMGTLDVSLNSSVS